MEKQIPLWIHEAQVVQLQKQIMACLERQKELERRVEHLEQRRGRR